MKLPLKLGTVALAAVLLGGACPDDDPRVEGPGTTTTSATEETTSTSTGGDTTSSTAAPASCTGTTSAQTAPSRMPRAEHTQLRTARQSGYDRVVFEFTGTSPGYDVKYVPRPIRQDGSGNEVTVAGGAVIEVRMDNASGYRTDGPSPGPTYTGPSRVRPGTPVVQEVVRTGDYEGVLTWAIGVRDRLPFRVSRLEGPHRLVVDVCG